MAKKTLKEFIAEYPKLQGIKDVDELMQAISQESNLSLAQIVAQLTEPEQELILSGTDPDLLIYDWNFWGRPSQIPPADKDWSVFAMVAGRGSGKTRAGSEWIQKVALENPGCRIGLVGRTAADARDVMVNGDSGIMSVGHPDQRPEYFPTRRLLKWPNGSTAYTFCTTPDTEVFTQDGWKTYDQLVETDKIRTLDVESGESRWSDLEKVHVFDVIDEPMISVEMSMHSSFTTLGHRWPVINKGTKKYRMVDSLLDFNTKDSFVTGVVSQDRPTIETYTDSLVALVGWYSAEGSIINFESNYKLDEFSDEEGYIQKIKEKMKFLSWTYQDVADRVGVSSERIRSIVVKGGGRDKESRDLLAKALGFAHLDDFFKPRPKKIHSVITQKNEKYVETISHHLENLLGPDVDSFKGNELNPVWRKIVDSGGIYRFILNQPATEMLSVHARGNGKVISDEFVDSLTLGQLELLVYSFLCGDGHQTGQNSYTVYQKDHGALNPIERACIFLGWCVATRDSFSYFKVIPRSRLIRPSMLGKIDIQDGKELRVTKTESIAPLNNSKDRRVIKEYTGTVWCPQTQDGTWLARRNGTVYYTGNSSEEPDQLRGPQFNFAWSDEAAAWKHSIDDSGLSTWDNLTIATRLGDHPQIFVTTTPKRTKFMFDLLEREKDETDSVIISRGSTMENAGNLSKAYLERIQSLYAGTRLAEQELLGLMLEEVEGALWDDNLINSGRVFVKPGEQRPDPPLKIIAVDPSTAENPKDECGIIVAGATNHRKLTDRHAYILEDASIMGSPAEWAKQVASVWMVYKCPVVVETNQGGALVKDQIHAINPDIPILEVWAYKGKALRAEPVTLKYDQRRVHHVDYLPELESQMVSWVPGETKKSPDRVDAMVYAITALLIRPPSKLGQKRMRARSVASRQMPNLKIG